MRKEINPVTEGRRGVFQISNELIHEYPINLFGHFVIVRAESKDYENVIEYVAYSHLFEVVPDNCVTPLYRIIMTECGKVWAEKVKDYVAEDNKSLREKIKDLEKRLGIIKGAVLLSE